MSNTKVRIRDVAESIGVSTATVSNVIHGKIDKISAPTIEKVQKALDELGYTPNMAAISLVQNKTPLIGVVVSAAHRYHKEMLSDPFVSRLIDSVSYRMEEKHYFMMLCRETDILSVPRYARMWNWAGAVFIGFGQEDYRSLSGKMPVPYVVVDGGDRGDPSYATCLLDNYTAGYQAGTCLIENGHTRAAFLSDAQIIRENEENNTVAQRYLGFADAFRKLLPDAPVPKNIYLPTEPADRIAVYDSIGERIKEKSLTAVFSLADLFSVELINHLSDTGFTLPDDLSVIGFDDIEQATVVRPRLTTFHQDMEQRGDTITSLLFDMIDNGTAPDHHIDPVNLVLRDSVRNLQ